MKIETLEKLAATYINGNISDTKRIVHRMSKAQFIDFAEFLRGQYGKKLHEIRHLVE